MEEDDDNGPEEMSESGGDDEQQEEMFAAIDDMEAVWENVYANTEARQKRGRSDNEDQRGEEEDEDEDYPPEEILPEEHDEDSDAPAFDARPGSGRHADRNIVRPFGQRIASQQSSARGGGPVNDDDHEEEDDEDDPEERERDLDREERRRRNRHFDSEEEEVGLRKTRELNRHFFAEPIASDGSGERVIDISVEPDEYAAGMILPNVLLDDENLYFKSLFTVLNAMGKETTRLLRTKMILEPQRKKAELEGTPFIQEEGDDATSLTPEDISNCKAWEKYWTSYVVENHYSVLGRILHLPIGPGGAEETITCSACLMWEIWRIKVILNHDEINNYRTWRIRDSEFLCERLINTPGVPLDPPPIEPIAPTEKELEKSSGPKMKEKYEADMVVYRAGCEKWRKKKLIIDTPVLLLKQSQIRHLLQFITSRLRIVPYHEDMRTLLHILELKSAIFFCRHMPAGLLDEPKFRSDLRNDEAALAGLDPTSTEATERFGKPGVKFRITRNYLVFCASYWYPIKRALYYAERFALMDLPAQVETVLPRGCVDRFVKWVEQKTRAQGERYADRIEQVGKESMAYPGDKEWHTYACINDSTNTDAILRAVRGEHAYNEYHAQLDASYQVVLGQVGKNITSDMFVFYVFDRYLSTYKGADVKWMNGYVILNEFIDEEESFDKWSTTKEPLLVCIWNGFWLMYDRRVWPIDNAYTAICAWMHAIRRTRKLAGAPEDCLSDGTYMGDIIDIILYGKEAPEYIVDDEEHREYTRRLGRGIPTDTTRVKL